jgi:hypothetical protein
MLFSRFFQPTPIREITEEATLSEMKALTDRLSGGAFREFTSPHRNQAGGGIQLVRKGRGTIATIGIIPIAGVKSP